MGSPATVLAGRSYEVLIQSWPLLVNDHLLIARLVL